MTATPDAPPTSRRSKPVEQPSQDVHLNIYQALLAASVNYGPLEKDSDNPYLKSKYLSLGALLNAVRPALTDQGIIITGSFRLVPQGWVVETVLVHVLTSETLVSQFPVADPDSPQKMGAARTYGERYNLLQLLGISASDDDGNSAAGLTPPDDFLGPAPSGQQRAEPRRMPTNDQPSAVDWLNSPSPVFQ